MGLGSKFKKAVAKVGNEIGRTVNRVGKEIDRGWHKSGLSNLWNNWIKPGGLIGNLADKILPDPPDVNIAGTDALESGANINQSEVSEENIAALRRKLAAKKTIASTSHKTLSGSNKKS